MNKSELVEAVASDAGVTKAEAEGVLSSFFDTVKARLSEGDSVAWPGFGKFATSARQARTGRNPQTGESVQIAASTAARFSASSVLKDVLNPKPAKRKAASKATAKKATATTKATAKKATAKKAAGTAKKATPAKATKRSSR